MGREMMENVQVEQKDGLILLRDNFTTARLPHAEMSSTDISYSMKVKSLSVIHLPPANGIKLSYGAWE